MTRGLLSVGIWMMVGIVGLGMPGCTPKMGTADPGAVAKQWSMMMREFGIVPIYPPREDVQPGDVYVLPLPPDAELERAVIRDNPQNFLPIALHVARLDVRDDIKAHYNASISLPATPNFASATKPVAVTQPTFTAEREFPADISRPRLGGFPEFFSIQLSTASAGAVVPTEILNLGLAATGTSEKIVKVSVPMVETVGLPVARVVGRISVDSSPITIGESEDIIQLDKKTMLGLLPNTLYYDAPTRARLDRLKVEWERKYANDPDKREFPKGYIVLITEVYYTRAIDVSVTSSQARAFGADVTPTAVLLERLTGVKAAAPEQVAEAATKPAKSEDAGNQPDENKPDEPAKNDDDPLARAMRLQQVQLEVINRQLASQAPGVSVRVTNVTANGVTMQRTYERPIAIGYRGIVYAVGSDGTLTLAGGSSAATPTMSIAEFNKEKTMVEQQIAEALIEKFPTLFEEGLHVTLEATDVRNGQVTSVTMTPPTTKAGVQTVDFDAQRDAVRSEAERVVRDMLKASTLRLEIKSPS